MDMRQRDEGDVIIFDLQGELRGGPADDAIFKTGVQNSIDAGARQVLLNLSDLRWINSTGLGFIVAVYHTMRDHGGTIKMCQPNERIAHIFATTRFDKVIGIYPTEKEALASF